MKKNKHEAQVILKHWQNAVPHDRLAHLVRDAGRAYSRALQLRLAQHEVSFGHWTFLRILWESDGLTQSELSLQAGVMEPTTFTAMKKMESLGYITRRHSPENKKNLYVHLTPKGRQLKKRLVPLAEEVNRVSVEGISDDEVAMTRRVLLSILSNLANDYVS
jgi:DNA-binding MarR family transcriptional regulator